MEAVDIEDDDLEFDSEADYKHRLELERERMSRGGLSETGHWTLRLLIVLVSLMLFISGIFYLIRVNIQADHDVKIKCIESGHAWVVGNCVAK